MQGSEIYFYADADDLKALLGGFQGLGLFRYTKSNGIRNAELLQTINAQEILDSVYIRPDSSDFFLISDFDVPVRVQEVALLDGSGFSRFAEQSLNPDSAMLKVGAQLQPTMITVSCLNTLGETPRAKEIFKIFKKAITREAVYIRLYYVLPGAMDKLKAGWRLAQGAGFPKDSDLQPPDPWPEPKRSAKGRRRGSRLE